MNFVPVIHVGPDPKETGGMAAVVGQLMTLPIDGYSLELYADTSNDGGRESFPAKIVRHAKHLSGLSRTIREHEARIVHIHTCSGFSFFRSGLTMLLAQSCGARVILHVHGARFDEYFTRSSSWKRWIIRRLLCLADGVAALSDGWAEKLMSMAPSARVVTIENATAMPEWSDRSKVVGYCRLLMLARMDVWKGVDDLLDAAELIRDLPYSLTMAGPAGTAGDEVSLRRKIVARNLPDRVTYIGNVQGAAKDRLLAESDVLVSPSHQEGMPISILEGMAHGLAIVATRVGAVAEMISDGDSGLLVASKDIDSLASSMKRMIQNESLRQKLGTTARLVAEQRFSPSVLARRLRTVYEGILDSGTSIDRITTEGLEPA